MNEMMIIDPRSAVYPERVRCAFKTAPVLYAVGNISLLEQPSYGICGSRNASDQALKRAFELGQRASEEGRVLVSGHSRGVDRQAHRGAMAGGGGTIAALPEGIGWFRMAEELRELAGEANFLAISMFGPTDRWQAWRAMERNRLIVALSDKLWAVDPGERGGTADAIEKCKVLGKPVEIERLGSVALQPAMM